MKTLENISAKTDCVDIYQCLIFLLTLYKPPHAKGTCQQNRINPNNTCQHFYEYGRRPPGRLPTHRWAAHINSSATTWHAPTHWRQAAAHCLHISWCIACLSHSSAHALQTIAHNTLMSGPKVELRAFIRAVKAHISAHSRHNSAHSDRLFSIQSVRHRSQAIIHAIQPSIQEL